MRNFKSLPRRFLRLAVLVLVAAGFGSCSTQAGLPPLSVLAFNFSPGFGGVHLNSPLEITFSAPVDPMTVNQDSIRIFTTTTTVENPDPGAPAEGEFVVNAEVVTFLPRIPEEADLSDAGLRIGFTYTIEIPASPDVIAPVRTTEGDPNVVKFTEFFTTLNSTILPASGDITAEPNLPSLHLFFIDEFDETNSLGVDPCPREDVIDPGTGAILVPGLAEQDRDSPQVIDTDPNEGESGFGTITGIQPGLGTAFVRLDPITLLFSEPIGPWRIRNENISIKNINLAGETFDILPFFEQDRGQIRLLLTVFDKDSAFDQASVPQGRYELSLTEFTDLSGNKLVNAQSCAVDGTFDLSFSTVVSPTQETDMTLTFDDDDLDGYVCYGGLATAVNDPNVLPVHMAPFLGGMASDAVLFPSPSNQTTSANWGSTAFWTGCEVLYDNGFDPDDPDRVIPNAVRLRGGAPGAATPIMAPIAGRATGPSDPSGSTDGIVPAAEPGKSDFFVNGDTIASLFTGNMTTGPVVYHYNVFTLTEDTATGLRPTLTYRKLNHDDSIFPLIIFVEDSAFITGSIVVDGGAGQYGFNGDNSGASLGRNPGGMGGFGGPGGGRGGDGGATEIGPDNTDLTLLNGQNGGVPANVVGPLDDLSEAIAGLNAMSPGGGGMWDHTQAKCPTGATAIAVIPAYVGGGGGGCFSDGSNGGDLDPSTTPGVTDHGVGGKRIGTVDDGFGEIGILASGGAGGGGGGADDDGGSEGSLIAVCPNNLVGLTDDGGGGGGGGGGFFGLCCAGDITFGEFEDPDDPLAGQRRAVVRAVGGRGGSTYATVSGSPPAPADPSDDLGQGEAGGGGGGGGICIIAGGQLNLVTVEIFAYGKVGGNSPAVEGGNRIVQDQGGLGGGGKVYLSDSDGIDPADIDGTFVRFVPNAGDPEQEATDGGEMTGTARLTFDVWGDDQREPMFGQTQIVTEFFDTLSDSTTYDGVRVLSNAPRFPYNATAGMEDMRTIRVFIDTTKAGVGGFPDMSPEDPMGGFTMDTLVGATEEIGLHFNADGDADPAGMAQYDSFQVIPVISSTKTNRFVRVRLRFDLGLISMDPNDLLGDVTNPLAFAPAGAPNLPIADDPDTPDLENTLGNLDTAPQGVPAVAEAIVTFTP